MNSAVFVDVLEIEELEEVSDVYDIEVETTHNFFVDFCN